MTKEFPTLYARSKNGKVREYKITLIDYGTYAEVITSKKADENAKETSDVYKFDCGVNIGKSNETTYLQQAERECQTRINKLLDSGFTTDIPTLKYNTDANGYMKPMLAHEWSEKQVQFPCISQPKYDGVRCMVFEKDGEIVIISRKGKKYNIPHLKKWAEENKDLLPLDGELYNHKEITFSKIVSAVKKYSELTDKIKYVVYDKPVEGLNNEERIKLLDELKPRLEMGPIEVAPHVVLNNLEEMHKYHDETVADGYEGVILRNLKGVYEFGFRSNNLIKYKEFKDAEFKIIDVVEGTGRDEGTAIFVCEIDETKSFKAKPKGSHDVRAKMFDERDNYIGKMATIKYQGLSDDGIPRFPSFISVRDYE